MGGLELASVVRQLRAELNEALDDADGERLRFELGVELSLSVTVGREAAPGAKIRFWVIEAGGGREGLAGVGPGHQARPYPPGHGRARGP